MIIKIIGVVISVLFVVTLFLDRRVIKNKSTKKYLDIAIYGWMLVLITEILNLIEVFR